MKPEYMQVDDLPRLREAGFQAGFSGESWFGTDKTGATWQAYPSPDNGTQLVFIQPEDRASTYLHRHQFEELFT